MLDIRITQSIAEIGKEAWNACHPHALEDFDYLQAVEYADIKGFHLRYIAAYQDQYLIAATPAFLHNYMLDTLFEGYAKKLCGLLRVPFPSALVLKLACLGSPVTEECRAGIAPSVSDAEKPEILSGILNAFESYAEQNGHHLVALKDIPESQQALWRTTLRKQNYYDIAGMPSAHLTIDFSTLEEYLTQLSPSTRKDMRRKWKTRDALRIEYRTNIDDVMPEVMALYHDTRNRAEFQFEELTGSYFTKVLTQMPDRAFCIVYFAGDDLLGINLLLHDETTLLDKFFCMDGTRGREFNLYFISWLTNITYCLEHSLIRYQSGQAGYENKLRLGSKLEPTSMYFKHRKRWVQGALRVAAPLFMADPMKEAA